MLATLDSVQRRVGKADGGSPTSGRPEWIDTARETARSLLLLLDAIDRGELVATLLEVARLQGPRRPSGR